METFTAGKVRDIVAAHTESSIPDEVLEVFRREDGKQFSKRILAKLPGGEDRWTIHKLASMTHISERRYHQTQGREGVHLLVSYDSDPDKGTISAKTLEAHNPGHFEARRKRNQERCTAANDSILCQRMATALNVVQEARERLAKAEEYLETLTDYTEGPFAADRYDWEKLGGKVSK